MLTNWQRRLIENGPTSNNKQYDDLAPSKEIENAQNYFEALDYGLRNVEIKNIALTGSYGSGKSSILKAYQLHRSIHKYLNISLATFDDEATLGDEEREKIEISILQQMFYHVKHRKIPDSRFKRIRKLHTGFQLLLTLLVLVWIIAGGITARISYFVNLPLLKDLEKKPFYLPSVFVLTAGITFLFVFWLIRSFRQARFSKLNVIKGEIEIDEVGKTSVLNAYLDEILYFFEANKFDVVIIEDLDRFKDPAIFTKLREINNLLNNSQQINRRIVFIYAIKDDIFKDRNRAKFFEFIIPVIPVINPSNSVDIFLRKLNAANVQDSINRDFLSVVTAYIDDMRMLKNIVNEYQLYRHILSDKLNQSMLFSMIIYKNLHPSDFADLHTGTGIIYEAFNSKPGYIAGRTKAWKERIVQIDKEMKVAEALFPKSAQQLRMLYVAELYRNMPMYASAKVGNDQVSAKELIEEAKFNELRTITNIRYYDRYQYYNLGFGFEAIEKKVDEYNSYIERLAEIKESSDERINELKAERASLQKKISEAQALSLSDILTTIGVDIITDTLQKDKLTMYLLRNGYIDEMYYSYISYFYEESITMQDRNFLFSIWNYEALPFDHALQNISELVKRIGLPEFSQKEVLNYSLLDYFLKNRFKDVDKRRAFIATVLAIKGVNMFLDGYFQRGECLEPFVKLITELWPDWWFSLEKQSRLDDSQLREYLTKFIAYADTEKIVKQNKENCLAEYIAGIPDFARNFATPELLTKAKALIKELKIQFDPLLLLETNNELVDFILSEGYYAITSTVITEILIHKKPKDINHGEWRTFVFTQNLSAIHACGFQPLIDRIEENIETYVQNVFVELKENTKETEENILQLLTNDALSLYDKESVLHHEKHVFDDISTLPQDLFTTAVQWSRVEASWTNVLNYYRHTEAVDKALINFLNTDLNYTKLAKVKFKAVTDEDKESVAELTKALLENNSVDDKAYEALAFSLESLSISISTLSLAKLQVLVNRNLLPANDDNFNALKAKGKSLAVTWLENKISFLSKIITTYVTLGQDEYLELLSSARVDQLKKLELISTLTVELLAGNAQLADVVADLCILNPEPITTDIYWALFDQVSHPLKLLMQEMSFLDRNAVVQSLEKIGEGYEEIMTNAQTKLVLSPINIDLAKFLEENKLISSYSVNSDKGFIKLVQFRNR